MNLLRAGKAAVHMRTARFGGLSRLDGKNCMAPEAA